MIVMRLCRCLTGYPQVKLPRRYDDLQPVEQCARCIDADTLRAVERLIQTLARAALR